MTTIETSIPKETATKYEIQEMKWEIINKISEAKNMLDEILEMTAKLDEKRMQMENRCNSPS